MCAAIKAQPMYNERQGALSRPAQLRPIKQGSVTAPWLESGNMRAVIQCETADGVATHWCCRLGLNGCECTVNKIQWAEPPSHPLLPDVSSLSIAAVHPWPSNSSLSTYSAGERLCLPVGRHCPPCCWCPSDHRRCCDPRTQQHLRRPAATALRPIAGCCRDRHVCMLSPASARQPPHTPAQSMALRVRASRCAAPC